MRHETSEQIVADFFAAFGRRDLDAVTSFFTDDAVYTVIGNPEGTPPLDPESKDAIPWIGTYRGPNGAREFIAHLQRNIEVIGFGPQEVIDAGDRIAVFGSFSYRAVPTGRQFDSDYAIRIKLRDGKFAEYSFFENTYAVAAAFRTGGSWMLQHQEGGRTVPLPAASPRHSQST
jgi:ketosteroid isomerase-like protein